MSSAEVGHESMHYLLIALAAVVCALIAGALAWSWWRNKRVKTEANPQPALTGHEEGNNYQRLPTHDHEHQHHVEHPKPPPHKAASDRVKPHPAARSSTSRRESDRLLPSRAITLPPNYSTGHHTDHVATTSRILHLEETTEEPQAMDEHAQHDEPSPVRTRGRGHTSTFYDANQQSRHDTTHPTKDEADKIRRATQVRAETVHPPAHDDAHRANVAIEEFRSALKRHLAIYSGGHESPQVDEYEGEISEGPGKRYRERARAEARLRKVAFENSKRAFRAGRKAEAKQLSDEGKMREERLKQFNALAAQEIFTYYNPKYQSNSPQRLTRCDLHGLHIDEARAYAEGHLVACKTLGVEKTMLIVGRGSHSSQGGPRIRPAILDMLQGVRGLIAGMHEKNEGCIVVEFGRLH